jgi:hypothetical protein
MLREKSSDGTEGDYHLVSHYSCVLDDGTWRGRSEMSQCKGFVLLALYAALQPFGQSFDCMSMATTFALGDQLHAIPGRQRPFNLTLLRPT